MTHFILSKTTKQQNWMYISDFRGIWEVLWKITKNNIARDNWGNTHRVESRRKNPTDYQYTGRQKGKKTEDRLGLKTEWDWKLSGYKEGKKFIVKSLCIKWYVKKLMWKMVKGLCILFTRIKTENQILLLL